MPSLLSKANTVVSTLRWFARIEVRDPNVSETWTKQDRKKRKLSLTLWIWQEAFSNKFISFAVPLVRHLSTFDEHYVRNLWKTPVLVMQDDRLRKMWNLHIFPKTHSGLKCRKTCLVRTLTGECLLDAQRRHIGVHLGCAIVVIGLKGFPKFLKKLMTSLFQISRNSLYLLHRAQWKL